MPSEMPELGSAPSPRQKSILDAALLRFGHYGFRRTSMEDVAQEAQISRTALYQHFGSKEKLLRALSAHLFAQALDGATEAALSSLPLIERIFGVLDAKLGFFYELVLGSEHGLEILDDSSRLCADIKAESEDQYGALLSQIIQEAQDQGDLSQPSFGMTPPETAQFFIQCAEGLMGKPRQNPSPADYRRRLRQLVEVLVAGFGGVAPPTEASTSAP